MQYITIKELAVLYGVSETTFHEYLNNHRAQLQQLATTYTNSKGKLARRRFLNPAQLDLIINKALQNPPMGYNFDGKQLIKIDS